MSVERKERRRCDICGEIISDAQYWSCELKQGQKDNVYISETYWVVPNYLDANVPRKPADVCLDCWERMKETVKKND